jgi:hypothetical protein
MITDKNRSPRAARALFATALCLAFTSAAPPAAAATFRLIYSSQYQGANGLAEGEPGVFYVTAAGSGLTTAFYSVTAQGTGTVLSSMSPPAFFGAPPVTGPNGRIYSSLATASHTANVLSVTPQGAQQLYPPQSIGLGLAQNLPDGGFLAYGPSGANSYASFIHISTAGVATPIAQTSQQLMGVPTLGLDGNYYAITQTDYTGVLAVVQATPSGQLNTIYTSPPQNGLRAPAKTILQAEDGNLYGALTSGGPNGTGFIFKLTLGGQYTLLYAYPKGDKFVNGPWELFEGSDGNFYGVAQGNSEQGQVFRVTKSGQYSVIYEITSVGCPCFLIQASDGLLWGLASFGGAQGYGGLFALNAGLPKPAPMAPQFVPASGAAGTRVRIWGYQLLGASVQFNGVAATDAVNSGPNYVWATVPEGATTGPITIATPGGSTTTRDSFTVQ